MVWGVIQNFHQALRYRGGWRNLLEHMYTVRTYIRWKVIAANERKITSLQLFVVMVVVVFQKEKDQTHFHFFLV